MPGLHLKDIWINRLKERVKESGLAKDQRALDRAKVNYLADIKSMMTEDNWTIIKDVPYDLNDYLNETF